MNEPLVLVITHDVDWGRRGPSDIHIINRLSRFSFDDRMAFFTLRDNLYNGISMIMECEYRQGIKSTFFFRYLYDDNTTVELYSDMLSELTRGGWEIGLHSNNGRDLDVIALEKTCLEKVAGVKVKSLRVHNLAVDPIIIPKLKSLGIDIDSSLCFSRENPSAKSTGCILVDNVIELPITVMDTYMFSYWGIDPGTAYTTLISLLRRFYNAGVRVATLLWHTNSVRMIGGRDYMRFIENIWSFEWLLPVKAIDVMTAYPFLCARTDLETIQNPP